MLAMLFACLQSQAAEVLIDQTVAVVGKQIITLRDVKVERAISAALNQKPAPQLAAPFSDEEWERWLKVLIRRALILQYLNSLELIPDVSAPQVETLRGRLTDLVVTDNEIQNSLRDRTRVDLFLEKHFPSRITVTEQDVRAYYETEKDRRFLGKPLAQIEHLVRADLRRERLQKEFEKWLETETRRTEVHLLPFQR